MKASALLPVLALLPTLSHAGDWPEWSGTSSRNMISTEKGLPAEFSPGKKIKGTDDVDLATTKNVKWIAKLGSQTYGTPTVSKGRVIIGTNNESPRDKGKIGDRGILYCLDEKTGKLIWQERIAGKYYSSPVCIDQRLYNMSRDGQLLVLAASEKFEELALIDLGEPTQASPAIAGGVLYLRTLTHLISVGE